MNNDELQKIVEELKNQINEIIKNDKSQNFELRLRI